MDISDSDLRREKIRERILFREQKNVGQTLGYTVLAIIIIMLFFSGYVFFQYVHPLGPLKPEIQRPTSEMIQDIEDEGDIGSIEEGLEYIGNELGGYKLKEHPITNAAPEIEFYMTNFDKTFTISVKGGNLSAVEGRALDPDVRLSGKKDAFIELLNSTDVTATVQKLLRQKRLQVEILASESELALKGYSTIYDMLGGAAIFEATGSAVGEFVNLNGIKNCFLMFFMAMTLLFVIVLYEVKK